MVEQSQTLRLARSILLALLSLPAAARADGAFPDSQALFLPADQPNRLLLSTNFGFMMSDDDGAHWYVVCEIAEKAQNPFLYQVGPPPDHRLFAVWLYGISWSADNGCTWGLADGGLFGEQWPDGGFTGVQAADVFPDPSDPMHVLAIARPRAKVDGGTPVDGVYESRNGGQTFSDQPIFTAPASSYLTGVEIARSNPQTVYLTLYQYPAPFRPFVVRSDNGGQSWQSFDLSGGLGSTTLRLAAVDPVDAGTLYLRLIDATGGESLGIAVDGGTSAASVFAIPNGNKMSGFLRRSDGALVVTVNPPPTSPVQPGAYVSLDNGATWDAGYGENHYRAIAERDGGVYLAAQAIAASGVNVEFAVGLWTDGGAQPLFGKFDDLDGLDSCGPTPQVCAQWLQNLSCVIKVAPQLCAPTSGPDAGPAADAGTPPKKAGCGCSPAPGLPVGVALVIGIFGLLRALARRRRIDSP